MTVTPFRAGNMPSQLRPQFTPRFTGTYTLLADVSEFQSSIADATYLTWSKAIVIRCAYGDAHDDKAWYGGQRRALLHQGSARFVGIYQYLVGTQDGAAQAQAFHSLVGAIRPGEVFIADFEEGAKPVLSAWYNAMLKLYGTAIAPYLWTYSGLNFGGAAGVLPVDWLAAYQSAEPTSRHKLWQFTSSYNVPGVGSCDCSVFHGSIDQLAALAYAGTAPAPPSAPAPAPTEEDVMQGSLEYNVTHSVLIPQSGSRHTLMNLWVDYASAEKPVTVRVALHMAGKVGLEPVQTVTLNDTTWHRVPLPDGCDGVSMTQETPGSPVGWLA